MLHIMYGELSQSVSVGRSCVDITRLYDGGVINTYATGYSYRTDGLEIFLFRKTK